MTCLGTVFVSSSLVKDARQDVKDSALKMEVMRMQQKDTIRQIHRNQALAYGRTEAEWQQEQAALTAEIASLKLQIHDIPHQVEMAKKKAHTDALVQTLLGDSKSAQRPVTPQPRTTESFSPAASTEASQKPAVPYWRPPSGRAADKIIRAAAIEKWGDNYSMVEHEINEQSDAFNELIALNRDYRTATKVVLANASQKWETNYRMMLYEYNRQAEANARLRGGR